MDDFDHTIKWRVGTTPPVPVLPPEVVAKTSATYLEAYERLTGKKL
jgi:phosphoribosylaminoimidazole-succinocarboxamide synthase